MRSPGRSVCGRVPRYASTLAVAVAGRTTTRAGGVLLLAALLAGCRCLRQDPDWMQWQMGRTVLARQGYPPEAGYNPLTVRLAMGLPPFTQPVDGFAMRVTLLPSFEPESVVEFRLAGNQAVVVLYRFDVSLSYYIGSVQMGERAYEGTGKPVRPPRLLKEVHVLPFPVVERLRAKLASLDAAALPFSGIVALDGIFVEHQWFADTGARSLCCHAPDRLADPRYSVLVDEVFLAMAATDWTPRATTYLWKVREYFPFGRLFSARWPLVRPHGVLLADGPDQGSAARWLQREEYVGLDLRYVEGMPGEWGTWLRQFAKKPTVGFVVDDGSAAILEEIGVDKSVVFRSPAKAVQGIGRQYMADWRAADQERRAEMLNRDQTTSLLLGRTKAQALALLGSPDREAALASGPRRGDTGAWLRLSYLAKPDAKEALLEVWIDCERDRVVCIRSDGAIW